jgi:hypothetical protein
MNFSHVLLAVRIHGPEKLPRARYEVGLPRNVIDGIL